MDKKVITIGILAILLFATGYLGNLVLSMIPGQTGLVTYALAMFVPAIILYYLLRYFRKYTDI